MKVRNSGYHISQGHAPISFRHFLFFATSPRRVPPWLPPSHITQGLSNDLFFHAGGRRLMTLGVRIVWKPEMQKAA